MRSIQDNQLFIVNVSGLRCGILNSDPIPAIAALLPPEVISKKSASPTLDDDGTAALERLRALDPDYKMKALEAEFNAKALVETEFNGRTLYASKHPGFVKICKDGADSLTRVFGLTVEPQKFSDLNEALKTASRQILDHEICFDADFPIVISCNPAMKEKLLPIVLG